MLLSAKGDPARRSVGECPRVPSKGLTNPFFEGSRGRIVDMLRRHPCTIDELASELHLTANAVRVQITAMERDGLVRQAGVRRGITRPSRTFELTVESEHLLSRAYVPLMATMLGVFETQVPADELEGLMRNTGRALARQFPAVATAGQSFEARLATASRALNEELGALTEVKKEEGQYVIRGYGCPLSAITGKHRAVCLAVESLLESLLGRKVRECCERDERPRCCFRVLPAAAGRPRA